jgi:hypothetical protein
MRQEKILLEAPREEECTQWLGAIQQAMQDMMARAMGRGDICGFKVLRIHQDGAGMVVSAVVVCW